MEMDYWHKERAHTNKHAPLQQRHYNMNGRHVNGYIYYEYKISVKKKKTKKIPRIVLNKVKCTANAPCCSHILL